MAMQQRRRIPDLASAPRRDALPRARGASTPLLYLPTPVLSYYYTQHSYRINVLRCNR
jgi:hypothetical protein